MPIIGLTDRGLAFPEIGQIRKGAKKNPNENRPGKDLTYFRVEFDEREQKTADAFIARYGEAPTEINVLLPFNEIERCWDAWLEAYTAGRMVARSDGEKFTYLVDTKTGEVKVKGSQPHTPYTEGQVVGYDYKNNPIKCRPVGRLKVIIPELGRAAYVTVMTTSVHDIAHLSEQLEAFKDINGGRIAGIPLVLRRRPKKISVPKGAERVRMVKWMLSIEADPEWVKGKLMEVKKLALPGNGVALLSDVVDSGPEWEDAEFVEEEMDDDFDLPSEPEEAEVEPIKMALENAQAVMGSDGIAYGKKDTAILGHMFNQIVKQLKLTDLPSEKREEYEYKRDAIEVILNHRANTPAATGKTTAAG